MMLSELWCRSCWRSHAVSSSSVDHAKGSPRTSPTKNMSLVTSQVAPTASREDTRSAPEGVENPLPPRRTVAEEADLAEELYGRQAQLP